MRDKKTWRIPVETFPADNGSLCSENDILQESVVVWLAKSLCIIKAIWQFSYHTKFNYALCCRLMSQREIADEYHFSKKKSWIIYSNQAPVVWRAITRERANAESFFNALVLIQLSFLLACQSDDDSAGDRDELLRQLFKSLCFFPLPWDSLLV